MNYNYFRLGICVLISIQQIYATGSKTNTFSIDSEESQNGDDIGNVVIDKKSPNSILDVIHKLSSQEEIEKNVNSKKLLNKRKREGKNIKVGVRRQLFDHGFDRSFFDSGSGVEVYDDNPSYDPGFGEIDGSSRYRTSYETFDEELFNNEPDVILAPDVGPGPEPGHDEDEYYSRHHQKSGPRKPPNFHGRRRPPPPPPPQRPYPRGRPNNNFRRPQYGPKKTYSGPQSRPRPGLKKPTHFATHEKDPYYDFDDDSDEHIKHYDEDDIIEEIEPDKHRKFKKPNQRHPPPYRGRKPNFHPHQPNRFHPKQRPPQHDRHFERRKPSYEDVNSEYNYDEDPYEHVPKDLKRFLKRPTKPIFKFPRFPEHSSRGHNRDPLDNAFHDHRNIFHEDSNEKIPIIRPKHVFSEEQSDVPKFFTRNFRGKGHRYSSKSKPSGRPFKTENYYEDEPHETIEYEAITEDDETESNRDILNLRNHPLSSRYSNHHNEPNRYRENMFRKTFDHHKKPKFETSFQRPLPYENSDFIDPTDDIKVFGDDDEIPLYEFIAEDETGLRYKRDSGNLKNFKEALKINFGDGFASNEAEDNGEGFINGPPKGFPSLNQLIGGSISKSKKRF